MKLLFCILFSIAVLLSGCVDYSKNENFNHTNLNERINNTNLMMEFKLFNGLPFYPYISYEDKLKIFDAFQKALNEEIEVEWQGNCSYGSISIVEYFKENDEDFCKFSICIYINSQKYFVINKAKKIKLKDQSFCWILENNK